SRNEFINRPIRPNEQGAHFSLFFIIRSSPTLRRAGGLRSALAGEHAEVTGIARHADLPADYGALDGATVLVRMRAVRVAAQRHERAELGEKALDFLRQ